MREANSAVGEGAEIVEPRMDKTRLDGIVADILQQRSKCQVVQVASASDLSVAAVPQLRRCRLKTRSSRANQLDASTTIW